MTEAPGDLIERTTRRKVTAIIDETGPDEIFGIGATVTDKPEEFAEISRDVRNALRKVELKYRKSTRETKRTIEKAIVGLGVEIHIRYIRRDDVNASHWWAKSGSERQQDLLKELAADLVGLDVDFDMIIIDDNTAMKDNAGRKIIEEHVGTIRNVGLVSQESSRIGEHKDHLQTNDFAIGTAGSILRGTVSETDLNIRTKQSN